jgi:spore coat protein U-like protein
MKNFLFIIGIVIASACQAQSLTVGKIDADGNVSLGMENSQGCTVLTQFSSQRNGAPVHVNDVSFTRLSHGQICLTGYEKDATGKIVSGIRIQCSQDDENNLILDNTNYSERIAGKSFDNLAAQN